MARLSLRVPIEPHFGRACEIEDGACRAARRLLARPPDEGPYRRSFRGDFICFARAKRIQATQARLLRARRRRC